MSFSVILNKLCNSNFKYFTSKYFETAFKPKKLTIQKSTEVFSALKAKNTHKNLKTTTQILSLCQWMLPWYNKNKLQKRIKASFNSNLAAKTAILQFSGI